jgi:hypothetical protein
MDMPNKGLQHTITAMAELHAEVPTQFEYCLDIRTAVGGVPNEPNSFIITTLSVRHVAIVTCFEMGSRFPREGLSAIGHSISTGDCVLSPSLSRSLDLSLREARHS